MCRSVRQTPHAATRSRTSPGPGERSSRSTGVSTPGCPTRAMARTAASSTLECMAAKTDDFDLGRLRLSPGEGRRLELAVPLGDFAYGGQTYAAQPPNVDAHLDISRMTGGGYSLR